MAQNSLSKQNSRLGIGAITGRSKEEDRGTGGENGQRLITAIVSATTQNKDLQACTQISRYSVLHLSESLAIPIATARTVLSVPFKNNKTRTTEAQFQLVIQRIYISSSQWLL